MLRPTPGDPRGAEHHHWDTGSLSLIRLLSLALQFVKSVTDRAPASSFAICEVYCITDMAPVSSFAVCEVYCITDRAPVSRFAVCKFCH